MTTRPARSSRRRTLSCIAALVGVAAPLCVPQTANAQEWLKDRLYQEGIGVRAGDFELHPGIAAELGYDSNWFYRSPKTEADTGGRGQVVNGAPLNPPQEGGLLRITPSITFSTLGAQRKVGDTSAATPPTIKFDGGLSATYREFFGPQRLRDQRNVSARTNLRLEILPERPIGFAVFGNYERTIQPNATGNPDNSFNRNDIGGGAEIIGTKGTLDWRLGYKFRATLFEDSPAVPYNNITHDVYTKGRWKFRPRTAFLYDGNAMFRNYLSDADRATLSLYDSTPVRARLGINGLVTSRFAFLGMLGWGSSFNRPAHLESVKQYNSLIAHAEFKFFLTPSPGDTDASATLLLSSIAIGYHRDFQSSYLGSHYGTDRGYAKVQYMFAGRFLLSLEGGVAALQYPEIFFPPNAAGTRVQANDSFTDIRADATLFGEYRFSNTFGLNSTLKYTTNISDTQLPAGVVAGTGGTTGVYDMNFRRFEAFLGVRWFL